MTIIKIEIVHKIRDFYAASVHEKSESARFYQESYQSLGREFTVANLDALTAVYDKMIDSRREEEKKLAAVDAYISLRNQIPVSCGILRTASADQAEKTKKMFAEVMKDCQERCPEIFKEEE